MSKIITRFAPSPTGHLHIGGARTALFCWLLARHYGGEFRLRIEDTDTERSKQEYTDAILASMRWLGLDWDGELTYQTQRTDRYNEVIDKMIESGHAYWCSCTPEEVEEEIGRMSEVLRAAGATAIAVSNSEEERMRFWSGRKNAFPASGRISPDCMDKFNVDGWNMEMIGAEHSPGFENTAGSLGQTISIAGGTAHARKRRGDTGKCYVLLGDGELQEGQTWECIQAAGYYKLDNFIVVIDANDQQVEGRIEDQMTEEPLIDRFTSFGAVCVEANGHDIEDFCKACETPHEGKPLVVIARTHGWTGVKPLEKPRSMHFIRIGADERDEFQKIYDEM